jgi:hypothetical protein
MLPSFSTASTRPLTPVFLDKAYELRDKLLEVATSEDTDTEKDKKKGTVDMLYWLGRATLDVIGLAGFDYTFNNLHSEKNELAMSFKRVFGESEVGGDAVDLKFLLTLEILFRCEGRPQLEDRCVCDPRELRADLEHHCEFLRGLVSFNMLTIGLGTNLKPTERQRASRETLDKMVTICGVSRRPLLLSSSSLLTTPFPSEHRPQEDREHHDRE